MNKIITNVDILATIRGSRELLIDEKTIITSQARETAKQHGVKFIKGGKVRKPFICGNWKMYKTLNEAVDLARQVSEEIIGLKDREVGICPPFTALAVVKEVIKGTPLLLGAQDFFWEDEGAFTGEVSPKMLKDCGCQIVIIGHSERRQYFEETDDKVNKKIKKALQTGLIPIVCCGERLEEKERGVTFQILQKQIKEGLKGLNKDEIENLVIAYEPIWAIGTGKTATPQQAQEVHSFIRKLISQIFGATVADGMRILYGGSIKPENITDLMAQEDIDGGLVGGASLKPDSFLKIVKF